MLISISIFLLFVIFTISAKIFEIINFKNSIKELFNQSEDLSNNIFKYDLLDKLPLPVQKYFRYVLKDGQPYISYVRLKHSGKFKTKPKNDWIDIRGEQYFTCGKPGFLWKGKTTIFTAKDMYIGTKGKLEVLLLHFLKIVNASGDNYNQGELLRWLGESVWFPTNFLPNNNLKWLPIDENTAKLRYSYNNLELFYIVYFNEIGQIIQIETERYYGDKNIEKWLGKVSNYKEFGGVKIPTEIEGIWKLQDGDYSYAKFKIDTIEYNIPERF